MLITYWSINHIPLHFQLLISYWNSHQTSCQKQSITLVLSYLTELNFHKVNKKWVGKHNPMKCKGHMSWEFYKVITSFTKLIFHYPDVQNNFNSSLELAPHRKSFFITASLNSIQWSHYSITLPPNHFSELSLVLAYTSPLIPEYKGKSSFPGLDMVHSVAL